MGTRIIIEYDEDEPVVVGLERSQLDEAERTVEQMVYDIPGSVKITYESDGADGMQQSTIQLAGPLKVDALYLKWSEGPRARLAKGVALAQQSRDPAEEWEPWQAENRQRDPEPEAMRYDIPAEFRQRGPVELP